MRSHHFMKALTGLFRDHPSSVGETYVQHLFKASGFGLRLVFAGLACLLHAIVPGAFKCTASTTVARLDAEMRTRVSSIERRDTIDAPGPASDASTLHAAD